MKFTPNNEMLKRMKVLESPDLIAILKRMEGGAVIRTWDLSGWLCQDGHVIKPVYVRLRRTLSDAGLIVPTEYEDYIEYRLTYTGTFEELVRNE